MSEKIKKLEDFVRQKWVPDFKLVKMKMSHGHGLGDPSYREISSNTPIYRLGHFCMNGVKTIWRM
jgi:hypothetical protein